MSRFRAFASQSPAIVIAIIALIFSLCSGAYAAGLASSGRPGAPSGDRAAGAGVRWHRLPLLNGWTPLGASAYRAPSYAISGGVLYLSGIAQAPDRFGGPPLASRLPQGARPPSILWLSFLNFGNDSMGEMEIEPNGDIFLYATTGGGPLRNPSFDGVSFPLNS